METPRETSGPNELLNAGWRARRLDDRPDLAHDFFSRSLEVARFRHDAAAAARALLALSNNLLWYCPKEVDESDLTLDTLCEEASELFREVGDESGIAACLRETGKFDESLAICQRINDQAGVIRSLRRLTALAACHNRHQEASASCTKAILLARELGDKELLASVLNMTAICWHDDDVFRQSVLLEAAELIPSVGSRPDEAVLNRFTYAQC